MNSITQRRLHLTKPCKASGKRKFRAQIDVLLDNATNPRRIRPYKCPDCGFWHGSSKL